MKNLEKEIQNGLKKSYIIGFIDGIKTILEIKNIKLSEETIEIIKTHLKIQLDEKIKGE